MVKGCSTTTLVQEVFCTAQNSGDPATIDSLINGSCLHCAFARVLFPELTDLTDQEIKDNYSDLRSEAKAPRFAFSFGGNAFTIHLGTGKPLKECEFIEKSFKELHAGLYTWGEEKLKESLKVGYVTTVDGFRCYFPNWEKFITAEQHLNSLSYEEKQDYYKVKKYIKDLDGDPFESTEDITQEMYEDYLIIAAWTKTYNSLKSEYGRICLNYPNQSMAAHITKLALINLFNFIVKNGHQWKARIAGVVHDEILLEVADPLTNLYKGVLEKSMNTAANKYIFKYNLKLTADAAVARDWYTAKKGG